MKILPINKYVIVGSYPLNIRWSKDIDVICYRKDVNADMKNADEYIGGFTHEGKRIECLFADYQESLKEILDRCMGKGRTASIPELFALKYV